MAQNTTNEYRKFRYYEGVCSSGDFIKEIAQVLSLGVRTDAIIDNVTKEVIQPSDILRVKNWDIVYPLVDKTFPQYEHLNTREKYLGLTNANKSKDEEKDGVDALTTEQWIAKIKNQVAQITDTVVLRTTTTPKDVAEMEIDDLSVSGESDMASTTMYLQFYKPHYLANPEEYPLDAELHGLIPQVVTKDMYKEARKSTASVIFDLAKLTEIPKNSSEPNKGLVEASEQKEYVDSVSNAYTKAYLFDSKIGILKGLAAIFGKATLDEVLPEPTQSNRTTECVIPQAYLNSIKQTNLSLYNFLFDICGLRSAFTTTDYDLIEEMTLKVTLSGGASEELYYVTLSYNKTVTVYTIKANGPQTGFLEVEHFYGHKALTKLRPEIYSEGRYVPLPEEYIEESTTSDVTFKKDVQFSLDKVVNKNILYGTIVLRYDYDKELDYIDLNTLKGMNTNSIALPNNHYCLVRMFDNPAADFSGPEPNIQDSEGNVTTTNSHTSPWSKLSWYKDFEEIMIDDIDEDVSVTSITDGTLLVPLETAGLTEDTRISYWINTNNDRFSLVVMGNPALDYENDRHLISSCYAGRIDSFENSVNDVSGNFALYTSSSTAPCKTVMTANDNQYHICRSFKNECFIEGAEGLVKDPDAKQYGFTGTGDISNIEDYKNYCKQINGIQKYSNISSLGFTVFYITLTGNKFFNENEMPRYMIIDPDGKPIALNGDNTKPIYYTTVAYRTFIYGTSDTRSNQVALYINPIKVPEGSNVYFNFGYYEEKFVITSGITRDTFGNVVNIETIDDYGKNTSDGVTSVSMYHTRSKAFYQKHHFLFATTEEYMSKVMYGKSSYTGEYYADRIKITHGNDGPRGILSDTLVIDSSSLYPKDELVINKDWEKDKNELEETFTYFPITAPYSPLSDGPNARYGIALKKAEKEPAYTDANKIIEIARNELKVIMGNNKNIADDVKLPSKTNNGCDIYWSVDPDSHWVQDINGNDIIEIKYVDGKNETIVGKRIDASNVSILLDENFTGINPIASVKAAKIPVIVDNKNQDPTANFVSHLNINQKVTLTNDKIANIYYGYSDKELNNLTSTSLVKAIDDGTGDEYADHIHVYSYKDFYVDIEGSEKSEIVKILPENSREIAQDTSIKLYNANPSKYLNIFFVIKDSNNEEIVQSYCSIPMTKATNFDIATITKQQALYDLLQYPCNILAYTTGLDDNTQGIEDSNGNIVQSVDFNYQTYGEPLDIKTYGIAPGVYITTYSHYGKVIETPKNIVSDTVSITSDMMLDDLYINVTKKDDNKNN